MSGRWSASIVDLADERARDQEQRHQLRRPTRLPSRRAPPRPRRDAGQQGVQQHPGAAADLRLDRDHGRNFACTVAESLRDPRARRAPGPGWYAGRRAPRRPPRARRRGRSTRPPRSTLRREISPSSGRMTNRRHRGEQREQDPGRPPGDAGDDPHRQRREDRADQHPQLPAQQVADLVGVVVDPVEHLADGLLAQRRRAAGAGPRWSRSLAQLALGPVRPPRPSDLRRRVDQRRADHAQRQPADQARRSGSRPAARPRRCRSPGPPWPPPARSARRPSPAPAAVASRPAGSGRQGRWATPTPA